MALPKVEIELNQAGRGTVHVDGVPLHMGSYAIHVDSSVDNGPPRVAIEMHAGLTLKLDAQVALLLVDLGAREQLVKECVDEVVRRVERLAEMRRELRGDL